MNKTFAALAFSGAALCGAAAPAAAGGYGYAAPGVTYNYGSSYGSTVTTYRPVTTYQAVTTYKPVTTYQPVTVYQPAPVYTAPVYSAPVYTSPVYSKPTTWAGPKRDWRKPYRQNVRHGGHYGWRR